MTDYWKNRQKQLNSALTEEENRLRKRLLNYYEQETKSLENEIASYFTKYGEDNVIQFRLLKESLPEADKQLLFERFDDFAVKYPQYANLLPVRESIYKLDRLQGLQWSAYLQGAEMAGLEATEIGKHLTKTALRGANSSAQILGFGKEFYNERSDIIKKVVNLDWSRGKNFSQNIWDNKIALSQTLNTEIAQGFARGDSYQKLSKTLRDRFVGVQKRQSDRLIYTEGTFVMNESQASVFQDLFGYYKIQTMEDGKVCDICRAVSKVSDEFPVRFVDRVQGENFPPFHPWCRCGFEIVVEDRQKFIADYVNRGGKALDAEKVLRKIAPDDFNYRVNTLIDSGKLKNNFNSIVEEKVVESVTKKQISQQAQELIDNARAYSTAEPIEERSVQKLSRELSENEIVAKLSGGDMTKGSCASLSWTYVANKYGLDVIDYRGGTSQGFFSLNMNCKKISELFSNVARDKRKNAITGGTTLLKQMEDGKEYVLVCGKHASVVRLGGAKKYQYLELQSATDSGWTDFNGNPRYTLHTRFGAQEKSTFMGMGLEMESYLIDIDSLQDVDGFEEIMKFINTAEDKQKKGAFGSVK